MNSLLTAASANKSSILICFDGGFVTRHGQGNCLMCDFRGTLCGEHRL
jgi:hypothetical protein